MARRRSTLWLGPLLAVVIVGGGIGAGVLMARRTTLPPKSPAFHLYPPTPAPKATVPSPPEGGTRQAQETIRAVPPPQRSSTQVAVIFDDAGGSLEDLAEILAIGRTVTVAVLPGLRYSKEVARRAQAGHLEVFLHLPLEADNSARLGPGGISTDMTDDAIAAAVTSGLAAVPGATGVNNHMGSRATANVRVMRSVLRVVKDNGLVFVDSMTSNRSVAASLADEMGIPTARRHVFLDNENDARVIRRQVRLLISIARRRGSAVGIGHATRQTPRILAQMLPEFDRLGIEFVAASTLAK